MGDFNGSGEYFCLQKVVRLSQVFGRLHSIQFCLGFDIAKEQKWPGIRLLYSARPPMPEIAPNLLLIDADVAIQERVSAMMADVAGNLKIATDCDAAAHILSQHLIDLIVFDLNVSDCNQQADSAIARFHQLKGQHDVPVLFLCGLQQTDVCLKTHPWGVAYHVQKSVEPKVLNGLILASLSLQVSNGLVQPCATVPVDSIPKPHGLPLPEVIMPPENPSVSNRSMSN